MGRPARCRLACKQLTNNLVEGFGRAPVLLLLIRRKLQGHHGDVEVQGGRQATRIVLNELGRAGGSHQQGLGCMAFHGIANGGLKELGGVLAEVAGLEGGVGDRRALAATLDHGEEQVGVGVALGCMEHVVDIAHGGGNAHGPHMGRPFVRPEGEFHARSPPRRRRRSNGRAKSAARSAA